MIQWSENLATGIQEIDRQHQEIINRVNNLYEY